MSERTFKTLVGVALALVGLAAIAVGYSAWFRPVPGCFIGEDGATWCI